MTSPPADHHVISTMYAALDRGLTTWVMAVNDAFGARAAARLSAALGGGGMRSADRVEPEMLGRALGSAGCSLDEAHDWLALVPAGRSGRRLRQTLHRPEALIRFTAAWAGTTTSRTHHQPVSVDMLRLQLHAHVQRAAAQGLGPDVALVVARATDPSPEVLADLADAAAAVFAAGEAIARCANGNVMILARRDDALQGCLDDLGRIVSIDPRLSAAEVHLWVEPVGRSVALLDALLIDLSA